MNDQELEAAYSEVQNTIRAQFEEIEAISESADNKDLVIEKLAQQNQYLFNQYARLYAKSLTVDDLAHVIDLSTPQEQEIKKYVAHQVTAAFKEKGELEIESKKLHEKINQLTQDSLNVKMQLEGVTDIYNELRSNEVFHLPECVTKIKQQHIYMRVTSQFLGNMMQEDMMNLAKQLEEVNYLQRIEINERKMDQKQNLYSNNLLRNGSNQQLSQNDNNLGFQYHSGDTQNNRISQILRENQREIEEELKKRKEKGDNVSESINACADRLRVMIEDLTMPSVDQLHPSVLLKAMSFMKKDIEELQRLLHGGEDGAWKQDRLILEQQRQRKQEITEAQLKEEEKERLSTVLSDYQRQVIGLNKLLQETEDEVAAKETLLMELNSKLSAIQLQLEEQQQNEQQMAEQYESRICELEKQLQGVCSQQNRVFEDEVEQIQSKLQNMIDSRDEYEQQVSKEKQLLQLENKRVVEENKELNEINNEFEGQIQQLKRQLQTVNNQQSVYTQQTQDQISLLRKQLKLKDKQADEMQITFNELEVFSKRQLEVIAQQQAQIIRQDKSEQFNRLARNSSEELQQLKIEFSQILAKTKISDQELLLSKKEIVRLQEYIRELQIEIQERSDNESAQLIQEIYRLKAENEQISEEKGQLEEKQKELMNNLEQLSDQNERSVEINVQLAAERDILQGQLGIVEQQLEQCARSSQKQSQQIIQEFSQEQQKQYYEQQQQQGNDKQLKRNNSMKEQQQTPQFENRTIGYPTKLANHLNQIQSNLPNNPDNSKNNFSRNTPLSSNETSQQNPKQTQNQQSRLYQPKYISQQQQRQGKFASISSPVSLESSPIPQHTHMSFQQIDSVVPAIPVYQQQHLRGDQQNLRADFSNKQQIKQEISPNNRNTLFNKIERQSDTVNRPQQQISDSCEQEINPDQYYSNGNLIDKDTKQSSLSAHKQSLYEDMKKLNSLASAMGERQQINNNL